MNFKGPNLSGELPYGQNLFDIQLQKYSDLNKKQALKYNISFIDVRKEFFENEKFNKGEYGLYYCIYLVVFISSNISSNISMIIYNILYIYYGYLIIYYIYTVYIIKVNMDYIMVLMVNVFI